MLKDHRGLELLPYINEGPQLGLEPVHSHTVAQCVGIEDEACTPWFAGDIGEFTYDKSRFVLTREDDWVEFLIDYVEGYEGLGDYSTKWYSRIHEATIIGNVHDNPELLLVK